MYVCDQRGQPFGIDVVAREKNHAADERVAQQLAFLGGQRSAHEVDHQRTETHTSDIGSIATGAPSVSSASDSMCAVWGNMSTTPAAASLKPCPCTSTSRSRARLPGWQEIYNTRRGANRATASRTSDR